MCTVELTAGAELNVTSCKVVLLIDVDEHESTIGGDKEADLLTLSPCSHTPVLLREVVGRRLPKLTRTARFCNHFGLLEVHSFYIMLGFSPLTVGESDVIPTHGIE